MKRIRRSTEQIIRILREAEVSQEETEQVCRRHNISAQTYCRWKSKYGGMELKEAQRLRWPDPGKVDVRKLKFCAMKGSRTNETKSIQ